MQTMIHKIHAGSSLPSVKSGTPYQIIGYQNSVADYSTVVFPADVQLVAAMNPCPCGSLPQRA